MDTLSTPDPIVERRLVVTGRVQGVGYRWFVRETARTFGVRGWVRNMPDGTVVVEVAATLTAITRFAAELEAGPPGAAVRAIRVGARPESDPLPAEFLIVR